jgi:nitrogen regulatory protein P-II 1
MKSSIPSAGIEDFFCFPRKIATEEKKLMKLIKAIIRHEKMEEVKEALTKVNVTGMTVTEVRGHGRQKGHKAIYRGTEYSITLLPKSMIETVVSDDLVESVVKTIIETARTGEIGDGRVFVLPVEHSYNVRTGERDIL